MNLIKKYLLFSIVFMVFSYVVLLFSFNSFNILAVVDNWLFLGKGFTLRLIFYASSFVSGIFAFLSLYQYWTDTKGVKRHIVAFLVILIIASIFVTIILLYKRNYFDENDIIRLYISPIVGFSALFVVMFLYLPVAVVRALLKTISLWFPDFLLWFNNLFKQTNKKTKLTKKC